MADIPIAELVIEKSDLDRLPATMSKRAESAVKRVGLLIEAEAVRRAPVAKFGGKRKGGNLKNSGTTEFLGGGFDTVAKTKFTAPYAIFVHEGTGIFGYKMQAYTIEPKNKKALFWRGAPHPFRKVTIRGMRARPFLKQAHEQEAPKLAKYLFEQ